MCQLRLVALHVESSAGESESFGPMLCSVSVSRERPSGLGPEEVGSRLHFCFFRMGARGISFTPFWVFAFFPPVKSTKRKQYFISSLTSQNNPIRRGVYCSSRFVSLSGCRPVRSNRIVSFSPFDIPEA